MCKNKYNEIQDGKTRVLEPCSYCDECVPKIIRNVKAKADGLRNGYLDDMMGHDLEPGHPCNHPGCCSHITHPCEECGRVGCH